MLLSASDLSVVLPSPDGAVRVLDGVTMGLAAGEIVDVVGPSGSGKTTLVRALARLMPGASGILVLDGAPAAGIGASAWRAKVALVPQKPAIFGGTVADNLLVPWRLKQHRHAPFPDTAALKAALDSVHLDVALDRDAARLSIGQQARVALMRVLLTTPRVLLMDEADAALDDLSSAAVLELVRSFARSGGGVMRVRHRASDGAADRRLRISAGRLDEAGS